MSPGALAVASAGPATITAATDALAPGILNHASSIGTLTSARSTLIRLARGPPLAPDSIANGTQIPATC